MQPSTNVNSVLSLLSEFNGLIQRVKATSDEAHLGFNVFALVSDIYYRENFHSDVIAEFLNPSGTHGQREIFLRIFIDLINSCIKNRNPKLSPINWEDEGLNSVEVHREKGRIDILILNHAEGQAIIIENKINNAEDTHRQLPTYDYYIKNNLKLNVVAIVYLTLDHCKEVSTSNWEHEEKEEIKNLLIPIEAYDGSSSDLSEGWLEPSMKQVHDEPVKVVLQQYKELLRYLTRRNFNKPLMEKFFEEFSKEDNYTKASTLASVLTEPDKFPAYLVYRLFNKLTSDKSFVKPFANIKLAYKNILSIDGFFHNGHQYVIDIECSDPNKYRFTLFERNYSIHEEVKKFLGFCEDSGLGFRLNNERWEREFNIDTPVKAEEEVLRCIMQIAEHFREVEDKE